MNNRHGTRTLAASTAAAALLLPFAGHAASQRQAPDPPPPGFGQCFMEPATWNEVLNGPIPRCPLVTPAPDTDTDTAPVATFDVDRKRSSLPIP